MSKQGERMEIYSSFWEDARPIPAPDEYEDIVDSIMKTLRAHWEGHGRFDGYNYRQERAKLADHLRKLR